MGNDVSKCAELLRIYGGEPWLVLRNYGLGAASARRISIYLQENETGGIKKLKHLDLTGNNLEAEGVDSLVQILSSEDAAIEELNLSGNPVGDDGCRSLQELVQFSETLRVLKLDSCGITDAGVAAIAAGIKANFNCKLTRANSISPVGVQAIIRCTWKPNAMAHLNWETMKFDKEAVGMAPLEWLSLDDNDIQDDGAETLAHALQKNHFVRLKRLSLVHNNIGTMGARKLAYMLAFCPSLQQLDIRNNIDIEENGALAFSEALDSRPPVAAVGAGGSIEVFEPEVFLSGGEWYWNPLKKAMNSRILVEKDDD